MKLSDCLHLHIDFETYSEVNLKNTGVYKYAEDPSTDVLMMSYSIGEGPVQRWRPSYPYPFAGIHSRLGHDAFILAWNAGFERIIWWRVMCEKHGWPKPPLHAFVCVAAWARDTASSPLKLESAGQFFNRAQRKDMAGHRLMLQMCRPATDALQLKHWQTYGPPPGAEPDVLGRVHSQATRCHHTLENIERLHAYCDDDVEVERGIAGILPEWDWPEIEQYWESERVNDRGLCVDVDFAAAAANFAEEEKADLADALDDLTQHAVTTPRQFARFQAWALPRMSKEAAKLTEWYDKGEKKHTFDADTRANLMAACEEDPDFLDLDVREAIEILDEAGKSTVAKYLSIRDRATPGYNDGRNRIHGAYVFAGAAQTGRYSSMGTQLHNLVRDVPSQAPEMIEAFTNVDISLSSRFGKPLHLLGKLVRPTITGDPRNEFDLVWGDWSSIEARIAPWLSMDPDAEDLLATFRRGEDVYLKTAGAILGKSPEKVTRDERQSHGKVPQLFLQYLGGENAFKAGAKVYGIRIEDELIKRIVKSWRDVNPWAKRFGNACEAAAMTAMEFPERGFSAGRVSYSYEPSALGGMGALFCTLPSERRICYPDPKIEAVEKPWATVRCITCRKGAWRPAKGSDEWPRVAVWAGMFVEGNSQAASADLLRLAIVNAQQEVLIVVGHSHDELLIESAYPEDDAPRLKALMEARPGWPGDDALPLKAEVQYGYRYKVAFHG